MSKKIFLLKNPVYRYLDKNFKSPNNVDFTLKRNYSFCFRKEGFYCINLKILGKIKVPSFILEFSYIQNFFFEQFPTKNYLTDSQLYFKITLNDSLSMQDHLRDFSFRDSVPGLDREPISATYLSQSYFVLHIFRYRCPS